MAALEAVTQSKEMAGTDTATSQPAQSRRVPDAVLLQFAILLPFTTDESAKVKNYKGIIKDTC
jgi:hypothetical protein